jgi:hypothetical protein
MFECLDEAVVDLDRLENEQDPLARIARRGLFHWNCPSKCTRPRKP